MTRELPPDFLYRLDQLIANRPDGGTVSDSLSEMTGVEKSMLHFGMVGTAGVVAAKKLAEVTEDPWVLVFGLALLGFAGKVVYNYMEAPRRR